jgi:glucose/arabinose dehydrogenase
MSVKINTKRKTAAIVITLAMLATVMAGCGNRSNGNETQPTTNPEPVIRLQPVADGFTSPVALVPSPDGTGRLFVADQIGTITILKPNGTKELFLDLRSKLVNLDPNFDECGLLGLAFHPQYQTNGRLYVYYSAPLRAGGPSGWNHTSHISEFKVAVGNPDKADPASERLLLQVDKPQFNHNGGQITFGPDGFLYIPLGDGGAGSDVGLGHPPGGNGQDTSTLLGSILRIDVDGGAPYGIPADNPFANGGGRPETFAWGLRNPFRIAFDLGGSHELFVGDAGQNQWEEINIVTKGGNYGWNLMEGSHGFNPASPGSVVTTVPTVDAAGRPLLGPIIEYKNTAAGGIGSAVIGGFVYRGAALPQFQGAYIFGDFSDEGSPASGRLFIAKRPAASGSLWPFEEITVSGNASGRINSLIRSFGQDATGELYVLAAGNAGPSGTTGKVFKIVP